MKYQAPVDLNNENSSQSAVARLIRDHAPSHGRILDVGCASGDLGVTLEELGFEVYGIEKDDALAQIAANRITKVFKLDIESGSLPESELKPFDAIVFGDVLEHLRNPLEVLQDSLKLLTPDGFVCSSIPNIAHASVKFGLLKGAWHYTEEGLLDRTHLRFFTLSSAIQLLRNAGLRIETLQATVVAPDPNEWSGIPHEVVSWILSDESALDFQYVSLARPDSEGSDASSSELAVQRLASPGDLRAEISGYFGHQSYEQETISRLRAELARVQEDRYRTLTVKDYAIGMEHELGEARYELSQRNDIDHQLRQEIIQTHSLLADAVADSQSAHARLADALTNSQQLSKGLTDLQQKEAANTNPFGRVYRKLRHIGGQLLRKGRLR